MAQAVMRHVIGGDETWRSDMSQAVMRHGTGGDETWRRR